MTFQSTPGYKALLERALELFENDEEFHKVGSDVWAWGIQASEALQAPSSEIAPSDIALSAIDSEPELPGDMPDEMWIAIRNDRDAIINAMRIAVRQTKEGIRERYLAAFPHR